MMFCWHQDEWEKELERELSGKNKSLKNMKHGQFPVNQISKSLVFHQLTLRPKEEGKQSKRSKDLDSSQVKGILVHALCIAQGFLNYSLLILSLKKTKGQLLAQT